MYPLRVIYNRQTNVVNMNPKTTANFQTDGKDNQLS